MGLEYSTYLFVLSLLVTNHIVTEQTQDRRTNIDAALIPMRPLEPSYDIVQPLESLIYRELEKWPQLRSIMLTVPP